MKMSAEESRRQKELEERKKQEQDRYVERQRRDEGEVSHRSQMLTDYRDSTKS